MRLQVFSPLKAAGVFRLCCFTASVSQVTDTHLRPPVTYASSYRQRDEVTERTNLKILLPSEQLKQG